MVQTAQQLFQNLGPTDYIVFTVIVAGLLVILALKRNKRKHKKSVDEHATYLGCETIPSTAFIGPGLTKF